MKALILTLLLSSFGLPHSSFSAPSNVLLILTDDQGYGDLSLHGNPQLKTPHLDRFGREGIQFTNFHVSPFCAPTRASLLTGRWSLRTGVTSVTANKEVMRESEVTLAEHFRAAGYRTACIGKWHNGEQYPHTANGQGFDEFFGFNGGHINDYFDAPLLRQNREEDTTGYVTDVLTDEAIRFMRRNTQRPFLCYLAYHAPHTPCQAPDRFFDAFKAAGLDDELAGMYAMCASLDENIGRLLAALDDMKLRQDTLVLFLTDNGAGTPRFNAGMRGYKTSVHEGGTRVPLFMQWPRRFTTPRSIGQLAAHIDLLPTLLELCEITPQLGPPVDGISLVPWLEGETKERDRRIFIHSDQSAPARPFRGGVRTARWRMVCENAAARLAAAPWQLYDMIADPGQSRDVAATHPEVITQLAADYLAWWKEVGGGALPLHRPQIGHAQESPVHLHAPQISRRSGLPFGVRSHSGQPEAPGFCHDWLQGFTAAQDRAEWDIEVVTAGDYQIEALINVPTTRAGDRLRLSAKPGEPAIDTQPLTAFPGESLPLPHRAPSDAQHYLSRTWHRQRLGRLHLEKGPATLTLENGTASANAPLLIHSLILTHEHTKSPPPR